MALGKSYVPLYHVDECQGMGRRRLNFILQNTYGILFQIISEPDFLEL